MWYCPAKKSGCRNTLTYQMCSVRILYRLIHRFIYIHKSVFIYIMLYIIYIYLYIYNIIYLHGIETCLKVTISLFYFCHTKNPSDVMRNIFNSISIYSWTKISLLTNIRNKRVRRKINLYFLTSWEMAMFFLQKFVIFSMITDSFLVEE